MKRFKYYKPLIGAIILAGVMIMMALRISDIANAIDAIITAFVPLIVGACIAFVLDILVVRYERWLWPKSSCITAIVYGFPNMDATSYINYSNGLQSNSYGYLEW